MRIVFIGAGNTAIATAQLLLAREHEVVIIERDEERIRAVSSRLDCGFLHGDGTRPDILKQADPASIDRLICLTDMDQENILASLVGHALGIPHVITKLEDPEFEAVATALGLETVVVPASTVGHRLADMVEGRGSPEPSSLLREDAQLLSMIIQAPQAGPVMKLGLPAGAGIAWLYRKGELIFVDPESELKAGDEVVIVARNNVVNAIRDRIMTTATVSSRPSAP